MGASGGSDCGTMRAIRQCYSACSSGGGEGEFPLQARCLTTSFYCSHHFPGGLHFFYHPISFRLFAVLSTFSACCYFSPFHTAHMQIISHPPLQQALAGDTGRPYLADSATTCTPSVLLRER